MNIEISIEAGIEVKEELLRVFAELFPGQHIMEPSSGQNSDQCMLQFFFEAASPDQILTRIGAAVTEIENKNSSSPGIDVHVRNMACSEPAIGSRQLARPFSPVEGIRIIPSNGSNSSAAARHDILLDSAHAFGTGLHPSTRLCLQLLKLVAERDEEIKYPPRSVLDVGCGSGILTIAALRLGAARALGIEIDPRAINVARRNLQRNRLVHCGKIAGISWHEVSGHYDLILANLVPSVLFKAVPSMVKLLKTEGLLITAGFPASRNMDVFDLFAKSGLRLINVSSLDGWGALLLTKKSTIFPLLPNPVRSD